MGIRIDKSLCFFHVVFKSKRKSKSVEPFLFGDLSIDRMLIRLFLARKKNKTEKLFLENCFAVKSFRLSTNIFLSRKCLVECVIDNVSCRWHTTKMRCVFLIVVCRHETLGLRLVSIATELRHFCNKKSAATLTFVQIRFATRQERQSLLFFYLTERIKTHIIRLVEKKSWKASNSASRKYVTYTKVYGITGTVPNWWLPRILLIHFFFYRHRVCDI